MKQILILIAFLICNVSFFQCQELNQCTGDGCNEVLGIDFGLTNLYIAHYNSTTASSSLILNDKDDDYTPTIIGFLDMGSCIGKDAIHLAMNSDNTNRTVSEVIQMLGKNLSHPDVQSIQQTSKYKLVEHKDQLSVEINYTDEVKTIYVAVQRMGFLMLKKMRKVTNYLDELKYLNNAVIALPVHFEENQKEAIRRACQTIKFNLVAFVEKPIAAVIAHKVESSLQRNVLVLDLSGTFFEISNVSAFQSEYKVVNSQVFREIAGKYFTERVASHLSEIILEKHKINVTNNDSKLFKLRIKAIKAIKELAQKESSDFDISSLVNLNDERKVVKEIFTRETLNELIKDYIPILLEIITKFLNFSRIELKDINDVVLVGGSMNIHIIQDHIQKLLSRSILIRIKPHEIVALGAAELGYLLGPVIEESKVKSEL